MKLRLSSFQRPTGGRARAFVSSSSCDGGSTWQTFGAHFQARLLDTLQTLPEPESASSARPSPAGGAPQ